MRPLSSARRAFGLDPRPAVVLGYTAMTADRTAGLRALKQGHTAYPDTPLPDLLETFDNAHPERDYWITFDCPEFTALCPITGQPDFGRIRIRYVPDRTCLESKSLKLYLFAYRNHGAFHEDVVNRVLNDLVRAVAPRRATVTGTFHPRGGIRITVEAQYPDAGAQG
jgi:7-cyano-7-deazaguanine reductase